MDLTLLNSIKDWIPPAGDDQVEGHREDGAESGGEAVQVGASALLYVSLTRQYSLKRTVG